MENIRCCIFANLSLRGQMDLKFVAKSGKATCKFRQLYI